MSDSPKVVPFGNRDELAGAVSRFVRELPRFAEFTQSLAKAERQYYEALIGEGFTPEQSLEMVKCLHYDLTHAERD